MDAAGPIPALPTFHVTQRRGDLATDLAGGGSWAIRFPAPDMIRFFAIVKGSCWLLLDAQPSPIGVGAGDALLLAAGRSFVLAGDLDANPVDATVLFSGNPTKTATLGERTDCVQIGGHVRLDPVRGKLLFGAVANALGRASASGGEYPGRGAC
jgi:hypothetical protein